MTLVFKNNALLNLNILSFLHDEHSHTEKHEAIQAIALLTIGFSRAGEQMTSKEIQIRFL